MKALSKRYSLEIISGLLDGPQYISKLSESLGIPYTTTQQRVAELERAGLVRIEPDIDDASKRAIKLVSLLNFRLELSPRRIYTMVTGEEKEQIEKMKI